MKRVDKPWGYEEILAHTETYVMKKMIINPGARMSLQYHEIKEETIYVISGPLVVWEESGVKNLKTGDIYHVVPKQIHRFGAGTNPAILIECSTTELDDVIRLEDDYNRN